MMVPSKSNTAQVLGPCSADAIFSKSVESGTTNSTSRILVNGTSHLTRPPVTPPSVKTPQLGPERGFVRHLFESEGAPSISGNEVRRHEWITVSSHYSPRLLVLASGDLEPPHARVGAGGRIIRFFYHGGSRLSRCDGGSHAGYADERGCGLGVARVRFIRRVLLGCSSREEAPHAFGRALMRRIETKRGGLLATWGLGW